MCVTCTSPATVANRRTFFKSSAALAVTLLAWRQGVLVPARETQHKISEFHFLTKPDIELLRLLLPTLLPFKEWDVAAISEFAPQLDATVTLMEPSVASDVRTLFDLFQLTPVRLWFGLPAIQVATPAQMEQALNKMQTSRLPDLRAAAMAFNEIICGVYYSNPATDAEIAYTPPLDLL